MATPSSVLGASWSPNAARTTRQASTRSPRSADATYTVDLATSASVQPAAASAVTRLSMTTCAWAATSPGATTAPTSSSGQAPAVNTRLPCSTTAAYAY